MKKILSRRALAIFSCLVLCMSLAVPAFAVDTTYNPVQGTRTTFEKALILDENANVPDLTFTFEINPGLAHNYSDGTMEVMSGDPDDNDAVVGLPTVGSAVYKPGDATTTDPDDDLWVSLDENEKAAMKTVTVDFTSVQFKEPGIYRYILTENNDNVTGVSYDTQKGEDATALTRYLDVYVVDEEVDGSHRLAVSQYVLHEKEDDVVAGTNKGSADVANAGDELDDKSQGFVNEFATFDLDLSKTVTGNQGSRDKYFEFTIHITGAGANAALDVDWDDAQLEPAKSAATIYNADKMAEANGRDDSTATDAVAATEWYYGGETYTSEHDAIEAATDGDGVVDEDGITDNGVAASEGLTGNQWVADEKGELTAIVYLKHGQNITIKGLASGAKYSIEEKNEDYKVSTVKTAGDRDPINGTVEKVEETTGMAEDHDVDYTNTRDGAVPTGIMMSALPGVAVIGLGAAGFGIFAGKKNKKEEDAE